MPSYSLKDVAKYFGVASPNRVADGATIFETYLREPSRVRSYALEDVMEVDRTFSKVTWRTFCLSINGTSSL